MNELTTFEKYVYNHSAEGESFEKIARDLNRSIQSVEAAYSRADNKIAKNIEMTIDTPLGQQIEEGGEIDL